VKAESGLRSLAKSYEKQTLLFRKKAAKNFCAWGFGNGGGPQSHENRLDFMATRTGANNLGKARISNDQYFVSLHPLQTEQRPSD
jgi:hypothetical protein